MEGEEGEGEESEEEEEEEEGGGGQGGGGGGGKCELVWRGVVAKPAFTGFKFQVGREGGREGAVSVCGLVYLGFRRHY